MSALPPEGLDLGGHRRVPHDPRPGAPAPLVVAPELAAAVARAARALSATAVLAWSVEPSPERRQELAELARAAQAIEQEWTA